MKYWPNDTFIVVDTETDGLDFDNDHVIQVGIAVFVHGQYVHGWEWLVNNGIPCAPEALAVHQIADSERMEHGASPESVFGRTHQLIQRMADQGRPVIGFNAPFDFSMLRTEWERLGFDLFVDNLWIVDPLVVDRHFETKIPIFTKPYMRLGQMAARYGIHQPKHRALADAIATGHVAIAQSLHHSRIRRMTPKELHIAQEGWYEEWADKFRHWGETKGIQFQMPPWPFGSSPRTRANLLTASAQLPFQEASSSTTSPEAETPER